MANRFLDTNYYKSPYVRGLKGALKSLYSFIICDCDGAGIWNLDLPAASLYTGFEINMLEFDEYFVKKQKAIPIGGDKYFFPDFIEHQYPNGLQQKNPAHKNFIKTLLKYDLIDEELNIKKKGALKGLRSPTGNILGNGNGNGKKGGAGENKIKQSKPPPLSKPLSSIKQTIFQPLAKDFDNIVPTSYIETLKMWFFTLHGFEIKDEKVAALWEVFKSQTLDGSKPYENKDEVYKHFVNWAKGQKIENGTNKFKGGAASNGSGISGTSVIPADKKYRGRL